MQERVIDLITPTSPSRETVNDLVLLKVNTDNLSFTSVPEVQDTSSEPLSSANILEEESAQTAAPDS